MRTSTKRILILPANSHTISRRRLDARTRELNDRLIRVNLDARTRELNDRLSRVKPTYDVRERSMSFELHKKIIDFLTSLPNIHDSNNQRAFILSAGLDAELQQQIYFSGPPAQFFQLLVPTLESYGTLEDGRNALEAVLEAAKNYVGRDRQVYCDSLIRECHDLRSSTSLQQKENLRGEVFELKSIWATRLPEIQQTILEFNPTVIHLYEDGNGEEGIVLEDQAGQTLLVDPESLTELFELVADKVECVVLEACYFSIQAQAIAQQIEHVIGLSQELVSYRTERSKDFGNKMAFEFVVALYEALGTEKSIEDAYRFACNTLYTAKIPSHLTPILLKKHEEDQIEQERVSQADRLYRLGGDCFKEHELSKAKEVLQSAISLNPQHIDAHVLLGRVYIEAHELTQALETLEKAYQSDPIKAQDYLLQALKSRIKSCQDPSQKIELYERIEQIRAEDRSLFELQKQLEFQRRSMQGSALLEVELLNRQEDLIWQDELVLKFQFKNKGNAPANKVRVKLSESESYHIIGDALVETDFVTPVCPYDVIFRIHPIQQAFTLNLSYSYTDVIEKQEFFDQGIQLISQPNYRFELIDNPYRSGNLIQELQSGNIKMFYGRRDTIRELKNILIDNDEGLVILYGQRRAGKSCLLKYIEKAECFEPDVQIIFTNIQGLDSEQELYDDILNQAIYLTDTTPNIKTQVHSFDEFTTSLYMLQEVLKTPFLIMLDEFEYVTDERFKYTSLQDTTDFLRKFRDFFQYAHQIKFAIAGADGLRAMINDYYNPLFKAGRTFHIGFLSPQDANALITEPLQDSITYTEGAITFIYDETANHPYYIQLLCQTIVMMLNQKKINTVTITEVNQAIEYIEKTDDGNFDYVWDITSKETHLFLAILAQEMQTTQWVALERIEEVIAEHKLCLSEESLDTAFKELFEKNLIIESHAKLEYTIPMGLLRRWVTLHKPLKRVRREFV